jgi:hypothetical protein
MSWYKRRQKEKELRERQKNYEVFNKELESFLGECNAVIRREENIGSFMSGAIYSPREELIKEFMNLINKITDNNISKKFRG